MENNNLVVDNDTVSLFDLWKVFASKWKIIVIVGLIAALLGGGVGFLTSEPWSTYSSMISFNLTPSDSTDALLYNLQSEMFAEKLLLEENGLPKKELCNADDYAAAVKANEEYEAARAEKAALKKELDKFNDVNRMTLLEKEYNHYVTRCEELLAILDALAQDGTNIEKIDEYEEALKAETAIRDEKYEKYARLVAQKQQKQSDFNLKSIEVKEKREASEAASEKVIAPWRESKEVRDDIATINKGVTYEYAKLGIAGSANDQATQDAQNKGYIKITLSIDNDEKLAKDLVDLYKERVPDFVEKHMEEISGTTIAVCTLISPFSEVEESSEGIVGGIVKYAAIALVLGVILAYLGCLVVFMIKKSENARKAVAQPEENDASENDKN